MTVQDALAGERRKFPLTRPIVAIGDIHANDKAFSSLFGKLDERAITYKTHDFVFLGDFVDGGPDAANVIAKLILMQKIMGAVVLKGNHEDMLVDALKYKAKRYGGGGAMWLEQGGKATLHSFYRMKAPSLAVDWMESLPVVHETTSFIFVHAGLVPPAHAGTIWSFDPRLWIRDEFIQSQHDFGKKVIFGHTYHPEPVVMPNKIGIDTMHHKGGKLTAAILDDDHPDKVEFVQTEG